MVDRRRPVVGSRVTVILSCGGSPELAGGQVIFDRGAGIVVEVTEPLPRKIRRGHLSILVYTGGEEDMMQMRGRVREVLTRNRVYFMPEAQPSPMEKRKCIRATMRLPAALGVLPEPRGELTEQSIELSTSGFKLEGGIASALRPGDEVFLHVRLPGLDRVSGIRSRVVRVEETGAVAGAFAHLGAEERDAILRTVFAKTLAEEGLTRQHEPH